MSILLAFTLYPTASFSQNTAGDNVSLVVGLGFAGPSDTPDYTLDTTILSSAHKGKATPQYMLGLAYSLGLNYYKTNDACKGDTKAAEAATATEANPAVPRMRCRPLGVFVSAKFSSESSSAVNGITFGLTHKITSGGGLSLLIAGSLSPFQQPSPGFINAAVQTTVAQKALNNPFYTPYDTAAMKNNTTNAFDGFSAVLMTNSGTANSPAYTAGAQIYNGNVLITNYKPGFLIGIALTPNALKLLTGGGK